MPTHEGLSWKARFIVTQDGGVDLPPDRQHVEGPEEGRREFLTDLVEFMPPATLFEIIRSKLRAGEIKTREAADVVIIEENGWRIAGNSNASCGYFYLTAQKVSE